MTDGGFRVLVLGAGAREHALCWRIMQSPLLGAIFALPGNPGMANDGVTCVEGKVTDFQHIKDVVLREAISLVIVGPEVPLVLGVVDYFSKDPDLHQVRILGPGALGARLEGSKTFAKEFMVRHGIPTARFRSFTRDEREEARAFTASLAPPYVLKADGLAAGKGVVILPTLDEAHSALDAMWDGQFGEAGSTVVIEEFLRGVELSFFILTDGTEYVVLPEAKDYKRALDGDRGLNTGGMGSISPVPFLDRALQSKIEERIVTPTLQGLRAEGIPYNGFIFFGLMCTPSGDPYVIEYNVRLGDPETQVVLLRVTGDFLHSLAMAASGDLKANSLGVSGMCCASVSLTSAGYPELYAVGKEVIVPSARAQEVLFHAGTREMEGRIFTSGGRVFSACGKGADLREALSGAYRLVDRVQFEGKTYRSDIGRDLL